MTTAELVVVGLSHHTAPLEVRERLSVATEHVADHLAHLLGAHAITEGVLVSTCNRVEAYAAATDAAAASKALREYMQGRTQDDLGSCLYERLGVEAVRHVFRVAASLDSMVVGEPQILGQMKGAFSAAEAAGAVGMLVGRCFHRAFAVAKRVRTETGIAAGMVSVSSIAIELARKIFGNLDGRRALLIGAGKMSEAAAKTLANQGARLAVVNRSAERAEELARACNGEARPYEMLASELVTSDVVITSTASPRPIITPELMHDVARARRHRPLFLIDIAVPRDVDPRVGELGSIFLYDLDDLQQVAQENLAARRKEAAAAEKIVKDEVAQFERWQRSLTLTPTVVALRERVRGVLRAELERTLPRLSSLSPDERKSLDKMVEAMVNKVLHQPLTELKRGGESADGALLIDATRRLFALETAEAQPEVGADVVTELSPAASRGGEGS